MGDFYKLFSPHFVCFATNRKSIYFKNYIVNGIILRLILQQKKMHFISRLTFIVHISKRMFNDQTNFEFYNYQTIFRLHFFYELPMTLVMF